MRRGRLRRLALALAVLLAANVAGGVAALRLIYRRFEGADHPLPEDHAPRELVNLYEQKRQRRR